VTISHVRAAPTSARLGAATLPNAQKVQARMAPCLRTHKLGEATSERGATTPHSRSPCIRLALVAADSLPRIALSTLPRASKPAKRRPPIRLAYGQRFDSNALLAEAGAPKRSSNGGSAGLIRAAQALATFFTPVAFEAEVRDGARMKRAWTDHGLEDGCGSPCADASGAVADVTTCGAEERHNLPARTVATP